MLTTEIFRPLLAACLLGNLLTLYGSVGEVEFLGYLTISASTPSVGIMFSNAMAITIFIMSKTRLGKSLPLPVREIPPRVHAALLVLSIALVLIRFTSGVPIFQGDASRLEGLLSVNPYLGLLSGVVPIGAAFLTSTGSKAIFTLKMVLLILVVGTASRLLLAAVLIGLVTSSPVVMRKHNVKGRIYLVCASVLTVLAITKIYAARTAVGIQQVYEYRINNIGGLVGWISDVIGPSIFYAARNGLVVHEILMRSDSRPPEGFVVGGLLHALNLGENPELWLTTELGFDAISVGAIATPIWSAAVADYGPVMAMGVALLIGICLTCALQWAPNLQYWFAFGVLLSYYGSYLLSSQFLSASFFIAVIVAWNSARRNHVNSVFDIQGLKKR